MSRRPQPQPKVNRRVNRQKPRIVNTGQTQQPQIQPQQPRNSNAKFGGMNIPIIMPKQYGRKPVVRQDPNLQQQPAEGGDTQEQPGKRYFTNNERDNQKEAYRQRLKEQIKQKRTTQKVVPIQQQQQQQQVGHQIPNVQPQINITQPSRAVNKKYYENKDTGILDHGASGLLDIYNRMKVVTTTFKNAPVTPDPTVKKFLVACEKEDLENVMSLYEVDNDLVDCCEIKSYQSCLHKCCFYNRDIHVIRFLIEKGANPEARCIAGKTPIQKAVEQGNLLITQFLIENGAKYKDKDLLQIASRKGNIRIVKHLLAIGLEVNAVDRYNQTSLHYAVEKENIELILLLLALNANPNLRNFEKKTSISLAGNFDIKRLINVFNDYPLVKEYVLRSSIKIEELEFHIASGGDTEKLTLFEELEKTKKAYENLTQKYDKLIEGKKFEKKGGKTQEYWLKQFEEKQKIIEEKDKKIKIFKKTNDKSQMIIEKSQKDVKKLKKKLSQHQQVFEKENQLKMKQLIDDHESEIGDLSEKYEDLLDQFKKKYEIQISNLTHELDLLKREKSKESEEEHTKTEDLSGQLENERQKCIDLENEKVQLQTQKMTLESQITDLKEADQKEKVGELQNKIKDLENMLENQKDDLTNELKAMEMIYEGEITDLKAKIEELTPDEVVLSQYCQNDDDGCFKRHFEFWDSTSVKGKFGEKGEVYKPVENGIAPGGRSGYLMFTDANGFWIFGGFGRDNVTSIDTCLNDLWMFYQGQKDNYYDGDGWIWESGDRMGGFGSRNISTSYSNLNMIGCRQGAIGFQNGDEFFVFGGLGKNEINAEGEMADLWSYDIQSKQWKSNGGYDDVSKFHFGSNWPGQRSYGSGWTYISSSGDYFFYVFGGWSTHVYGAPIPMNDFWVYNLNTGIWSKLGGTDDIVVGYSGYPVYGSSYNPTNSPGSLHKSITFSNGDSLYLFGGEGRKSSCVNQKVNDLWEYSITFKMWRFLAGDQANCNTAPSYAGTVQYPGARSGAAGWYRKGYLYVFGGEGYSGGGLGQLNDIFAFNLYQKKWEYFNLIEGAPGTFANPKIRNDDGQPVEMTGYETLGLYPCSRRDIKGVVNDNRLYFFGGADKADEMLQSVWYIEIEYKCDGVRRWDPSVCNTHGTCTTEDDVCRCNGGYLGDECNIKQPNLDDDDDGDDDDDTGKKSLTGPVTVIVINILVIIVIVIVVIMLGVFILSKKGIIKFDFLKNMAEKMKDRDNEVELNDRKKKKKGGSSSKKKKTPSRSKGTPKKKRRPPPKKKVPEKKAKSKGKKGKGKGKKKGKAGFGVARLSFV